MSNGYFGYSGDPDVRQVTPDPAAAPAAVQRNETPWTVIGYEQVETQTTGDIGIRLCVTRAYPAGISAEGTETNRIWYKPRYVNYTPQIGDVIIPILNRQGYTERIVVVGQAG